MVSVLASPFLCFFLAVFVVDGSIKLLKTNQESYGNILKHIIFANLGTKKMTTNGKFESHRHRACFFMLELLSISFSYYDFCR